MLSNWKEALVCAFVAAALALPSAAQTIVDFDSDGMDDVWEELYGAQSLLPGGDDDEDGETNLEESLAGTNPFDSGSWLRICGFTGHLDSATVTWPTQEGKLYRVQFTSDLGGEFQDEGTTYPGTGGLVTAHFSDSQDTFTTGVISEEVWTDLPGDTIADLTGAAGYPGSPDAVHGLPRAEIRQNQNNDYGGRLRGFIQVPITGVYTFSIASRGESELWLSLNEDPANRIRVAWVTGDQVLPKQWDLQANQRSFSLYLTAEHRCYFEVLHQHAEGLDHLSVGWEGPGIPADDPDPGPLQVIEGQYLCPWVDGTDNAAAHLGNEFLFARVTVEDIDQDGDGISDWAEKQMAGDGNFSFADSVSTASGWSDAVTMSYALTGPGDVVEVVSVDAEAVENNAPDAGANPGSFRIIRKGGLQPLAVNFGFVAAPFPGESAEPADYTVTDGLGNPQGTTVIFPFGGVASEVMIHPVDDGIFEYPEQARLQIMAGSYSLGVPNNATIPIIDLRDLPGNEFLFAGSFGEEPSAGVPTVGNGFVSAKLNGPRNRLLIFDNFFNLTSPQNDSHIHKANAGPAPGSIVYEITNVPGDPESLPLIGQLGNYPWDIGPAGSFTAQQFIDSLFNQNGESKLYLNIHTNDNPVGEIWAFLNPVIASIDPPDPPPPPPPVTQLFGDELERECWRFLNQATFGATQAEVDSLVAVIIAERATVPNYSRIDAFEDWIDAQVAMPQTYILDYLVAATNQEWKLRGYFDQARWTSGTASPLPAQWPSIDRSDPDPAQWVATADYPVTVSQMIAGQGTPNHLDQVVNSVLRHALWTVMLNSKDQLRQRVGFALQQINVVSYQFAQLELRRLAMANYQDMLNHHAFGQYRDVIEHVANSPVMAKYLSSLQNQKAFDLDFDGNPDVFPDENLAREIMQLFSVGLFVLHLDGSLALSAINGLPIPTYDNDDITELARVFTGQSYSTFNPGNNDTSSLYFDSPVENNYFFRGGNGADTNHQMKYPMKMFGDFHDTDVKTILGGKVISNTSLLPDAAAVGYADVSDVVDWLAGIPGDGQPDFDMVNSHQSTPPFIARRLIQRMITSNPSREYLYRVAKAFKDGEGSLLEAVKAILLDYEAREMGVIDNSFGYKKSPFIAYLQLLRAFDAHSYLPVRDDGTFPDVSGDAVQPDPYPADMFLENFGYPTAQANNFRLNSRYRVYPLMETFLTMEPMRQVTVFNFYNPDYSPAGPVSAAGLVAPEMHILHAGSAIQNLNEFHRMTVNALIVVDPLGMKNSNQALALGLSEPASQLHSAIRIDRAFWSELLYPSDPLDPDPAVDERMRDTVLVDAIDMMLTAGRFKETYPDDPSDDTIDPDPMDPEVGPPGPNPRETILNFLGESYDVGEPLQKFRYGLYLMTTTPEFWIRK